METQELIGNTQFLKEDGMSQRGILTYGHPTPQIRPRLMKCDNETISLDLLDFNHGKTLASIPLVDSNKANSFSLCHSSDILKDKDDVYSQKWQCIILSKGDIQGQIHEFELTWINKPFVQKKKCCSSKLVNPDERDPN